MTNQQQVPTQQPLDTSRHEESTGFDPQDLDMLAAFTKRVSTELHKVDSQNVGSNSNIRAHQLEQKKILDGIDKPVSSEPRGQTAQETTVDKQSQPDNGTQSPVPQPHKKQPAVAEQPVVMANDIDNRLRRLESSVRTIQKARRIKKGVSYNVSSNGFKGVIKDAELLADFIINEVAKGVKTITIRSTNDTKDKEQE